MSGFLENFFGTFGVVTTVIGLTPQIYKSFRTKSTENLSMIMLLNYFLCCTSWTIYGFYVGSKFVIWSNIIAFINSVIIIFQKIYYDRKKQHI